ncbi:MAG: hypothetical protein GY731_02210, partial [Gammaproteobacteria bacterium]|nr:hypothetical protein [Gammaproteobacteria bacterium]
NGAAPTFTNTGTLQKTVATGDTLFGVSYPFTFNNAGTLDIQSGTVSLPGGSTLSLAAGSVLKGSGAFSGNVELTGGSLRPGGSGTTGKLSIAGNVTMDASSVIDLEFEGTGQGTTYDWLEVSGTAALDGTVNVTYLNGYEPSAGDNFTPITSVGAMSGTFATTNVPGNTLFTESYNSNDYSILIDAVASIFWDDGAVGNSQWTDPLNWSTDLLPISTDDVFVDIGGGNLVTLSSGTHTINSLFSAEDLTISGTGSLTVADSADFVGALNVSGGTLNLNALSTVQNLNFSSGTLAGTGSLAASGTSSSWSGGSLDLSLTNSGTFITNGVTLGGAGLFINQGLVRKTAGDVSTFGVAVNNEGGSWSDEDGGLGHDILLGGGGSHSGTFTINGGNVKLTGGTHTFADGAVAGAGTLWVDAGVTAVVDGTVSMDGNLLLNGGTLTGGTTGILADGAGNSNLLSGAIDGTLINEGLMFVNGSSVIGGSGTLVNRGVNALIRKTSGEVSTFGVAVNNEGGSWSDEDSGLGHDILLGGGGSHSGAFAINNGNVKLTGGTHVFNDGATAGTGVGNMWFSGAVIGINGTVTFPNNLSLSSGGLQGIGTIIGNVSSTGGTLQPGGAGTAGKLTIAGDLTMDVNSTLLIDLGGDAQGTGYDWLNVTGDAVVGGSLVTNLTYAPADGKTFDILTCGGGGAPSCSGGFTSTTLPNSNFSVQIDPGQVRLLNTLCAGDICWTNSDLADSNWFTDGNWNIGRAPITGEDVVIEFVDGSTVVFNTAGSLTIGSLVSDELLEIADGTLIVSGSSNLNAGLLLSGSEFQANGAVSAVNGLILNSGTFSVGAGGVVTHGGNGAWSAGSIIGAGEFKNDTGASLTISTTGTRSLNVVTFTNDGAVVVDATALNFTPISGQFINNNELTMTGWGFNGGGGSFTNSGSGNITRLAGGGAFSLIGQNISNSGSAESRGGELAFFGNGSHTGASFDLNGGNLQFNGTAQTLDSASSVTGVGRIIVTGAGTFDFDFGGADLSSGVIFDLGGGPTVNLNAADYSFDELVMSLSSGGLNVAGDMTVNHFTIGTPFNTQVTIGGVLTVNTGNLDLSRGSLSVTNAAAFNGGLTISGGTLDIGGTSTANSFGLSSGILQGVGGLTSSGASSWSGGTLDSTWTNTGNLSMAGNILLATNAIFENSGAVIRTSGSIALNSGSEFNNLLNGTFDIQGDGTILQSSAPTDGIFNNLGSITRSAGTGTATFSSRLANDGSLSVSTGKVRIGGGIHAGNFDVATGAILEFYNGSNQLTGTSSVTGAGDVEITCCPFSTDGSYAITGTTTITSPFNIAATFNTDTFFPVLNLSGTNVSLQGSGDLSADTFNWSGGSIRGSGDMLINAGGTLNVSGADAKTLGGTRTLSNAGTIAFNGAGDILGGVANTITNLATGTLDIQSDLNVGAPVVNNGFLDLNNSLLAVADSFTNGGTIDVGTGTLTILGDLTLNPSSVINIAIEGPNQGMEYGWIDVTGDGNLNGSLDVSLAGGFLPDNGDVFEPLTCGGSCLGSFASENLPADFSMEYGATLVELRYTTCIGDICWDNETGNGLWFDALNWDSDLLPGSGDDVVIDFIDGTAVVFNTAGSLSIGGLVADEAFSLDAGSLTIT